MLNVTEETAPRKITVGNLLYLYGSEFYELKFFDRKTKKVLYPTPSNLDTNLLPVYGFKTQFNFHGSYGNKKKTKYYIPQINIQVDKNELEQLQKQGKLEPNPDWDKIIDRDLNMSEAEAKAYDKCCAEEDEKKFFVEITVGELLKLYKKRHDKVLFFDWRTKKQIHPKIDVSSLRVYGFKTFHVCSNGSEEFAIVLDKTQLDQLKKTKPKQMKGKLNPLI